MIDLICLKIFMIVFMIVTYYSFSCRLHKQIKTDISNNLTFNKNSMKVIDVKKSFKKLLSNNDFYLQHCHTYDSCYNYSDSEKNVSYSIMFNELIFEKYTNI